MILIGTSGFSYEDWKGHFYPEGIKKEHFLEYYSRYFETCEINSTYYTPPTVKMCEGLLKKSHGRVVFCIKANQKMTHQQDADESFYKGFIQALSPLEESGKLGAILAQFPQSLKPDEHGKKTISRVWEGFAGKPLVFEFRNALWAKESVFEWLSKRNIGLCCVDEPPIHGLFPPIVRVTSTEIAYLRFHGKNKAKWYNHEKAYERYDYLYSEFELQQWVQKIKKLETEASKVFVFYNNHFQAKAVKNALMLKNLLEQK